MIAMSFGFGAVEAELWKLIFIMTRIGAALLAAPFFGAAAVPPQLRVAMTAAIAVAVSAWQPIAVPPALLSIDGLLAIAGEVCVGLALGFVLQIAFAAPIVAAEQIGGAMGMSIAATADPVNGGQSPALGQYFMVTLALIFLGLGGHLAWLRLVIESYRLLPPGEAWLDPERFQFVASLGSQMFVTAATIALPVTLVLVLVQLAAGVLSRSAPSLNLFSLGLPAGVLAGIAALIAAVPLIGDNLIDLSEAALVNAAQVSRQ